MLLEAMKHGDSSFITLTYADKIRESINCKICKSSCARCNCKTHSNSLIPADARNFGKRLRKILEPQKIRYFLVGEYGKETQRPHFHLICFGLNPLIGGGVDGFSGVVRKAWPCGHVFVGDANIDSMQYVAGYVTEKLASTKLKLLPKVLGETRRYEDGRIAEFSRISNGGGSNTSMSLRGGIGAPALSDIARIVDTPFGLSELINSGDVPASLSIGRKSFPLARYLRRKLRELLGLASEAPEKAQRIYALKMQDVYKEALAKPKMMAKCVSASDLWKNINMQRALNLGAKYRVFQNKYTI